MSISKSLDIQVGGDHYKKYAIQPLEFAEKAELTPIIFCIFKYVCRFKDKNKPVEDLEKALHCIDVFLECGCAKPIAFDFAQGSAFLAQFDKLHKSALSEVLTLQIKPTVEQADRTRNSIRILLREYESNAK